MKRLRPGREHFLTRANFFLKDSRGFAGWLSGHSRYVWRQATDQTEIPKKLLNSDLFVHRMVSALTVSALTISALMVRILSIGSAERVGKLRTPAGINSKNVD